MIKYYIKKPFKIPALEWDGLCVKEMNDFLGNCEHFYENSSLFIITLEGNMEASIGDYILKGVHGEFYPCKPDIFKETYNEVNE